MSANANSTSLVRSVRQRLPHWLYRRRTRVRSVDVVDFRDRISIASWPLVLGLGLSLFLVLPTIEFSFVAFRSPVTIPLTGTFVAALFLSILAASGAESVVTAHPRFLTAERRSGGKTWPFWALPMALTNILAVLLPRAPTPLIQVLGLLIVSGLLILAFFALYYTVEPGQPGFRRARLALNILTYGSALVLFLFVYQARTRSLVSGSLVALTSILLAIELLRTSTNRTSTVIAYGMIVGLILGQVTWALNYWPLPDLTGGLLLLLIFYLLVGIAQHGLQGRLTRRVLVEFAIFAVVALLLIATVGPGFTIQRPAPPPDVQSPLPPAVGHGAFSPHSESASA